MKILKTMLDKESASEEEEIHYQICNSLVVLENFCTLLSNIFFISYLGPRHTAMKF